MQQLTFVEAAKVEWRDVPASALEGDEQAIVRPLAVATCDLDSFHRRAHDPDARRRELAAGYGAEVLDSYPERLGPFPITVDASASHDGAGGWDPQPVTSRVAAWEDASDALVEERGKLVVSR